MKDRSYAAEDVRTPVREVERGCEFNWLPIYSSCPSDHFLPHFGPGRWCELLDLGNFGRRQAHEQVFQIIIRVDTVPTATTQQRIDHGATFTGVGVSNEHPIAFSQCAGPNAVLDFIIINFHQSVGDEPGQRFPAFQRIINRLAEQSLYHRREECHRV
jgi:hypothetical protein